MAVSIKAIKRRLTSVKNTRKITKAMELVAASKMRKAVEAVLGTRSYAQYAREVLEHIASAKLAHEHPLLIVRPVEKVLMVVLTSNRGLCGGLNANVLRKALELIRNPQGMARHRIKDAPEPVTNVQVEVLSIGKKGERAITKLGVPIIASFVDFSDTPTYLQAQPVAQMILDAYAQGTYDKVVVVYSDFVSVVTQRPKVRQLLPISSHDIEKMLLEIKRLEEQPLMAEVDRAVQMNGNGAAEEFLFEPDPKTVLDTLLPRLVEVQVYQSILEGSASEHSARMMAMRNASEAAGDMISDLVFTLNRARQASITSEIAEINSGVSALT